MLQQNFQYTPYPKNPIKTPNHRGFPVFSDLSSPANMGRKFFFYMGENSISNILKPSGDLPSCLIC